MSAEPSQQFAAQTERFRRELLAHCYRMSGSPHDAEDLVQETYLRAWRSFGSFDGRASLRTWLYTIATNVCLTGLESKAARMLPSGLSASYEGVEEPPTETVDDVRWLEPIPDAWISTTDPAAIAVKRESVRLALIASLQHLPARQRAIFLLREVLSFSAEETAAQLGSTVGAVKSGLQRARAQVASLRRETLLEPTDPRARALLEGYVQAFERADGRLLQNVLHEDARLEATPYRDWRRGRFRCVALVENYLLRKPGEWRMLPTLSNGQPAIAAYRREGSTWRASDLVVLEPTADGITRVVAFHDTALFEVFGFPEFLIG